jgi:hypothetical protein
MNEEECCALKIEIMAVHHTIIYFVESCSTQANSQQSDALIEAHVSRNWSNPELKGLTYCVSPRAKIPAVHVAMSGECEVETAAV